jgi:hypothetical protein
MMTATGATSDAPAARPPQPLLIRAIVAAIVGAVAGAVCLFVAYARAPGFVATLDTPPLEAVVRGLHPTEFEPGGLSFAWTGARVTLVLDGLDRSRTWTLLLRAKAGRGPGLPMPAATIAVDGATRATAPIGGPWQDVRAVLPADGRTRPTRITVDVAPTFVPGPGDARTLGLILDEIRLVPDGMPTPPRRALVAAAIAGGILAASIAVVGVPLLWTIALALGFAIAQGVALATGAAPYSRTYLAAVPQIATTVAIAAAGLAGVAALLRRQPLSRTAATAVAIAAIALVLGLDGLLHPGKAIVDAMFHAHRLDSVLAGHYFFTQPMPSGVEFPYAVGLYVTAALWAGLTRDHVLLLRVVVVAAHVLAALMLYPLVERRWRRPGAAVAAVAAYLLAPLPFIVIGNANQTYAFGQSIATMALAASMTWPLDWRRPLPAVGLVALLALGLLSHVGLVPLLGGLVGTGALLLAWRGQGEDRRAGWVILVAALIASVLAVGLYYRHFGDAFRSAQRVGQSHPGPSQPASPAGVATAPARERPTAEITAPPAGVAVTGTSRAQRAGRAAGLGLAAYGAPLLLLALAGAARLSVRTRRDRATLMVMASIVVCALVAGVSVLAPVEPRFERYTDEFISRLYYAVTPAVALLAAAGAAWLWTRGVAGRSAAVAGLLAALLVAAQRWLGWLG